jgi:hypothetical protein
MESKFKITKLTNLFPILLEYREESDEGVDTNRLLEIYIDFFESQIYVRDLWNRGVLIKFSEFKKQCCSEKERNMYDGLESEILKTIMPEVSESPIMPQVLTSLKKMDQFKSGNYQEFEGFNNNE